MATFVYGTQFQVDANGGLARVAPLTATTAIALYSSSAAGVEARHITNSGGILTGGTVLTIDANQADSITICRLSNTTALIGYAYGATHRVRVLSVSGTTLTAETATNMTDTGVDYLSCDLLDTNKVIYVYTNSGGDGLARILTLSGVAITENASFTYQNSGDVINNVVVATTTIAACVAWIETTGPAVANAEILDISGTTITGNADVGLAPAGSTTSGNSSVDLSVSVSDATYIYSVMRSAGDDIYWAQLLNTAGTLTRELSLLWATPELFNFCTIAVYKHVSGADPGYDYLIAASNDADNDRFEVSEYDPWFGGFASDTTINTTNIATVDGQLRVFPGTTNGILVWNGTTEAITITSPTVSTLGLAPMTKPAAIDAAGAFIYVALLDGGTPILTKISTALNADGTTVFNPGAGDNIGVECGRFNSDVVWVAGQFDGTNVVEKSEDAGTTFTVKDDATIGGVRAFVMGPDSDARIMVFDEDNSDILETRDDGASWKTINASVGPTVNAIGRLGENVEESVFGNQGAANNSIDYSVNSGDDLQDFQTGVYPAANATKVIVN